ncbi:MAG: DoxX family protein [Chlorobiaceae bacterium]|nr:DoxX family protein [Chlorobiaceae bacterium]NTV16033.1 DoxX family protein [Chlorobiaceae bacterium]
MFDRFFNNSDVGKLLLRVSVGTLMLFHGVNKLQHGYGFVEQMLLKAGFPGYLSHGILVGELLAPFFMVLGLYTRQAALIQAFVMVMAIYLVHTKELFSVTAHGGYALELPILYLFGSLAVFFLGAGRFSVSRGGGLWN